MNRYSQTEMVTTDRLGRPCVMELNTTYGYWTGARRISDDEAARLNALPPYLGARHSAEMEHMRALGDRPTEFANSLKTAGEINR